MQSGRRGRDEAGVRRKRSTGLLTMREQQVSEALAGGGEGATAGVGLGIDEGSRSAEKASPQPKSRRPVTYSTSNGTRGHSFYADHHSPKPASAPTPSLPTPAPTSDPSKNNVARTPPIPSDSSAPYFTQPTEPESARKKHRDLRRTPPNSIGGLAPGGVATGGIPLSPISASIQQQQEAARIIASSHDFSHLPPSPSSSSIHQFLRQAHSSSSPANFQPPPHNAPLPPSASYPTAMHHSSPRLSAPPPRSTSQHMLLEQQEKDEVLRRLDGLHRSPSGSRSTKSRKSVGPEVSSVHSRPGTPPHPRSGSAHSNKSRKSLPPPPNPNSTHPSELDPNLPPLDSHSLPTTRSSIGTTGSSSKRASSSSTSMGTASTGPSAASLHTTRGGSSAAGEGARVRRNSNGSDVSSLRSEGALCDTYAGSGTDIPPVPPIPKGFASSRSSTQPLATLPPTSAPAQVATPSTPPSVISPSASSFSFQSSHSHPQPTLRDMQNLNEEDDRRREAQRLPSTSSTTSIPLSPNLPSSPATTSVASLASSKPKVSKKWSFSSALHLKMPSSKQSSSSAATDDTVHDQRYPSSSNASHPAVVFPSSAAADEPGSPLNSPWSSIVRSDSSSSFAIADRPSQDSHVTSSSQASVSTNFTNANSLAGQPSYSSASTVSSKKITPSSIPFFRRSSSSSQNLNAQTSFPSRTYTGVPSSSNSSAMPPPVIPQTPRKHSDSSSRRKDSLSSSQSQQDFGPPAPSQSTPSSSRKSMLGGMGLPNMLKSSLSRKNLHASSAAEEGSVVSQSPRESSGGGSLSSRYRKKSREPETVVEEREREKPTKLSPGTSNSVHGRLSSMGLLGRKRGKVRHSLVAFGWTIP
jgi:dual specificity tyrosine-phosphorylation-regulated kinase 2/3/4